MVGVVMGGVAEASGKGAGAGWAGSAGTLGIAVRPKCPSMVACTPQRALNIGLCALPASAGASAVPVSLARKLEKGFDCAAPGAGGGGGGASSSTGGRPSVALPPGASARAAPVSVGAKSGGAAAPRAGVAQWSLQQFGACHKSPWPLASPPPRGATAAASKSATNGHVPAAAGAAAVCRGGMGSVGANGKGGAGGSGGGRASGLSEKDKGKDAAGGKEVGTSTCNEDLPVGTLLEVLLDTGEWCSAKISAPKNKNQKYEVMFGDDESDKARCVCTRVRVGRRAIPWKGVIQRGYHPPGGGVTRLLIPRPCTRCLTAEGAGAGYPCRRIGRASRKAHMSR